MQANKTWPSPTGGAHWVSRLTKLEAEFHPVEPVVRTRLPAAAPSAGGDPRCGAGCPRHRPSGEHDTDLRTSVAIRVVACVLLVLSSWWLVACGSGANPSSSTTATTAAILAATSRAPSASPPPGGPAPARLLGTWTRVSKTADSAAVLTITTNGFHVADNLGGGRGDIVVNTDEIDFFNVAQCGLVLPQGVGRYQWRLRGATLHLTPLNHDPCPVRDSHFANQDFTRSGG